MGILGNSVSVVVVLSMMLSKVASTCSQTDTHCVWTLNIHFQLTMMDDMDQLCSAGGHLYDNCTGSRHLVDPVPGDVIVADGSQEQKLAIAINGAVPGPTLWAWEGQTVTVVVNNQLEAHAATVHWHGQWQRGTPWVDGVAYVTQCPIPPGAYFNYTWKAEPAGTFWYHSHLGAQLAQGLVGAFIVRKSPDPFMSSELVVQLQDWNNADGPTMMMYKDIKDISFDASMSGLINGRGRHYAEDGTMLTDPPLTVFNVKSNNEYKIRLLNVGGMNPFRFSIDSHMLTVVAADGFDIVPVVVDAIIVNVGERFDVILHTNQSGTHFWMRGDHYDGDDISHIRAEAILIYNNAPEAEPSTVRRDCTVSDKCVVFNCPAATISPTVSCVNVGQWRTTVDWDTPGGDDIRDIFLNFGIWGGFPNINGKVMVKPHVNALIQPQEIGHSCDTAGCAPDTLCHCTHALSLEGNHTYQLILTNLGGGAVTPHPIHMHGHSFYVVKVSYSGTDITCTDTYCTSPRWADPTWAGSTVPGSEVSRPARRDVVIVPTGGYVVIRIRSNNPGLWYMHCHIETHNFWGMALMLNESFPDIPAPPKGNYKCGSFADNLEDTISCDCILCQNGGTCVEDPKAKNGFRCGCKPGASGRFCEIDLCGNVTCVHGTCEMEVFGAQTSVHCECDAGWTGPTCDMESLGEDLEIQCSTFFDCIYKCPNGFGTCLENLHVCQCHEAEFLTMEVAPDPIYPGCTTSMSVTCSLMPYLQAAAGGADIHWSSLIITRKRVTLASVTYHDSVVSSDPAHVYVDNATVAGTLLPDDGDIRFLQITWADPEFSQNGTYTCVAHGIQSPFGKPVTFTEHIDVILGPQPDRVAKMQIEGLEAQIEHILSQPTAAQLATMTKGVYCGLYPNISNAEVATLLQPGFRVVRGDDWPANLHDDEMPLGADTDTAPGTVTAVTALSHPYEGVVLCTVDWDNGNTDKHYQMGPGNYQLQLLCMSYLQNSSESASQKQ